jgi:hypothetical protein
MKQPLVMTEKNLYELLAFLVSSAYLCINEPKLYGTFRLIDGASRLIELSLEGGQLEDDRFLRRFKESLDERKLLLMTDEKAYFGFLEDATRQMAKEMKRRAVPGTSPSITDTVT